MSTNNQQVTSKERFWRMQVRRWRTSGLSVRDFCAEQGLSEPSFYAWRRTLAEREATAVQFVPVTVTPEVTPEVKTATGADGLAGASVAGEGLVGKPFAVARGAVVDHGQRVRGAHRV